MSSTTAKWYAGIAVFLLLVTTGCSRTPNPDVVALYRVPFDTAAIEIVENVVWEFARERGLQLVQKDRDQMTFLTQGVPAFFVGLRMDDEQLISVNNVGVGDLVTIMAVESRNVTRDVVRDMADDLTRRLEAAANLEFEEVVESQANRP